MDTSDITTINASEKLKEALKLLEGYTKKNRIARAKLEETTPGYKAALDQRIANCRLLIAQWTANPNAPTLSGSPNDPNYAGNGPGQAADIAGQVTPTSPGNEGDNGVAKNAQTRGPPIDPNLDGPPPKKPRAGYQQPRHRKIVQEDPIDTITNSIPATLLIKFLGSWALLGAAVESADPSITADGFPDLCYAAVDLIEWIDEVAGKANFSASQFRWRIDFNGGPVLVSHLIALHDWLLAVGLIVAAAPVQSKPVPAVKKARVNTVKIVHEGKQVTLTRSMALEARLNPEMYPGCVEAGMDPILAVLRNRAGNDKCLTCDSSGPRGKALYSRPDPPPEDHPFLKDCKCPINGAALELWMIKVTANREDVPQRGDDDIANGRLALNPDILKVISGAMEVLSGHTVDTLLQPESDRLEHTVNWALERLHSLAESDGSKYAPSLLLCAQKFKETLQAILMEDSEEEE